MADEKITSIEEYRNKIGEIKIVILPSGAIFKVRKLTVLDYIKEGIEDIPNEFYKFITELAVGNIKTESESDKKNLELFEKYLLITIEKGIVEPPIILKYDKSKISTHLIYAELPVDDQKYLIDVITGKI